MLFEQGKWGEIMSEFLCPSGRAFGPPLLSSSPKRPGQEPLGRQPALWLWTGPTSSLSVSAPTCHMRRLDVDLLEALPVMTFKDQGIMEYRK